MRFNFTEYSNDQTSRKHQNTFVLGLIWQKCTQLFFSLLGHFRVTVMSISIVLLAFLIVLCFFPETLPADVAERAKITREMELNELETKKEKAWWYISRPARELSILNRNRLFRLVGGQRGHLTVK